MPKKLATIDDRIIALDARPDRIDLRDLPYRAPMENLPPRFPPDQDVERFLPAFCRAELILDQGQDGACTGFGLAATVNYLLWRSSGMTLQARDRVSPRMLYQLARYYDEWPDENYEGSSCRGALKGWQKHGVCSEALWPYSLEGADYIPPKPGWERDAVKRPLGVYYRIEKQSVVDLQSAINRTGAIFVSANVHEGWSGIGQKNGKGISHATLPRIARSDQVLGGHAFALVGYNEFGFIVQNSWGMEWGADGFAVLSYGDWVENGTDAWVVGLGVPVEEGSAPKAHVGSQACQGHTIRPAGIIGAAAAPQTTPSPHLWTQEQAYLHTLVTGNNGTLLNRMPYLPDAQANARLVCLDTPRAWLQARPAGQRHLALFLHGGLGSEASSIARIRAMGPYFQANGVYPLFLTWKSGWLDVISDMISDKAAERFGTQPVRGLRQMFDDARDRAIEVLAREVLVRSMWNEMKQNVEASALGQDTGLAALLAQLAALKAALGGDLNLHLMGHSAGSIIAGRLLTGFAARALKASSCTLYAPACTAAFALEHYKAAAERGVLAPGKLAIHVLSDELELDDSVGPYRKSLLYLVSRSLELLHKTPILGLANVHDASRASEEYWHRDTLASVREWQQFLAQGPVLTVLRAPQLDTGGGSVNSTHGSFDNAPAIIGGTLRGILNVAQLPFPHVDLS